MTWRQRLILMLFVFDAQIQPVWTSYGFLDMVDPFVRVCVNFDSQYHTSIPSRADKAISQKVTLWEARGTLCDTRRDVPGGDIIVAPVATTGTMALTRCSLTQQAVMAQLPKKTAILFVVDPPRILWADFKAVYINRTVVNKIGIYFISRKNYDKVQSAGKFKESVKVKIYQPDDYLVDPTKAIMISIAMFTLIVSGYQSGIRNHSLLKMSNHPGIKDNARSKAGADQENQSQQSDTIEDAGSELSNLGNVKEHNKQHRSKDTSSQPLGLDDIECRLKTIIICTLGFVAFTSAFLLLLYFQYKYFVWVVIVMFTFGGTNCLFGILLSIYNCMPNPGCSRLNCTYSNVIIKICCCIKERHLPTVLINTPVDMCHFLLLAVSIAFGVSWIILRNEWYAFIMQDILGMAICIHVLKVLFVPSLKWITCGLIGALIYDLFFVFISPFFTKSGCSIMYDVATGGACSRDKNKEISNTRLNMSAAEAESRWFVPRVDKSEKIPILFRVPRIESATYYCVTSDDPPNFAMLGFGDILIPGVLICYCHAFDLARRGPYKLYFVASILSYLLGLIVTYIALSLMETPQPALLYLVPITLLTIHFVALINKEWKLLWTGEISKADQTKPKNVSGGNTLALSVLKPIGSDTQLIDSENNTNINVQTERSSTDIESPIPLANNMNTVGTSTTENSLE